MDRGLTQHTLALRLGVHLATVSLWERGRGKPLARQHGAIFRIIELDQEPPATNLAERLRQVRLRLGLTQELMAARLGVSEATLNRWETANRRPKPWLAGRVASLLGKIETGDSHTPDGVGLSVFDRTRWRRRLPSELQAVRPTTSGEEIRLARIARGMSQAAAARLFGVTHTTLYRWESGRAPVPRRRKAAIRRFLRL